MPKTVLRNILRINTTNNHSYTLVITPKCERRNIETYDIAIVTNFTNDSPILCRNEISSNFI